MGKEDGNRVVRERVAGMKLKRRPGPEHGGCVDQEDFLSSKCPDGISLLSTSSANCMENDQ